MKIVFLLLGFLAMLANYPLYACDIVDEKDIQRGDTPGVGGYCSNNGEKIECYEVGEYYGGITCDGPQGVYSGYNLMNLIYSACNCSPEDEENIEEQMRRELNR